MLGRAAIRAVADENELGRHFRTDKGEDFDDIQDTLHRAEIRKVHQDGFAAGRPLGAAALILGAMIEIAVHEIADDLNWPTDVEFLDRPVAQVAGDGGDAVALLDREARDGQITAVIAHERDVRAVEGGDERQAAGRGHGPCEQSADGMRDRVMDVEEIKTGGFGDFGHFYCESQRVRRMIKQRIRGGFSFVEKNCGHARDSSAWASRN